MAELFREGGITPGSERVPIALRLFEVGTAVLVLLVFSPLMALIAILVRLSSRGPALFWHTRLGLNGKPFRLVKFRTHYVDARHRFPSLGSIEYSEHSMRHFRFKPDRDPRVTRLGEFLRSTSLDELPNFWNVIRGDLALVGPRPEIGEMVPFYPGECLRRFAVRPGIGALAEVSGRNRLLQSQKAEYDLLYVKTRSTLLDLQIMIRIVWVTIFRTRDAL